MPVGLDCLRARLSLVRGKTPSPRTIEPVELKPGAREVVDARFLLAEARHAFRAVLKGATLRIDLRLPLAQAAFA
ncbi:MAG: hypothetical protein ACI9MC_003285 [Kiritimatiellia bacterium]|jgi:hypothetical protein